MKYGSMTDPEKWIIKGIPALFVAGSVTHFVYEFTGSNYLAGLITAVNESVWEHTKMIVWPFILWWFIYYVWKGKSHSINSRKWFSSCLVSIITGIVVIPLLFYFYTEAFGAEIVWIDILILLVADIIAQLIGLHYYRHGRGYNSKLIIVLILAVAVVYMLFTRFTPHIPMFQDSVNGTYGIKQLK